MKVRPCRVNGCVYHAMKGKQKCEWHWLLTQPAHIQKEYASRRALSSREVRSRVSPAEWPPGERFCSGCRGMVPLFYTSGSQCKAHASAAAHARRIGEVYDITPEKYDEIFELQGRRCFICTNRPRTQRLAVDHDHKTGEVRGLLCKRCNHDLLGGGHDDPAILRRALLYLWKPPAQREPGEKVTWEDYLLFEVARLNMEHAVKAVLERQADPRSAYSIPQRYVAGLPQDPPF